MKLIFHYLFLELRFVKMILVKVNNQKKMLNSYISNQIIFSEIIHTHAVCKTHLPTVNFDESKIKFLPKTDKIIDITSNYMPSTNKKTKKMPNAYVKKRANNGSFDSQIQFNIKPYEDKKKIYKVKVFCNGKVIIPGIQNQNLCDIYEPLNILCRYLDEQGLSKFRCFYRVPEAITHNYKMKSMFVINPRKMLIILRRYKNASYTFPLFKLKTFLTKPTIDYPDGSVDQIDWLDMILNNKKITHIHTNNIERFLFPWDITIKKKSDIDDYQLFSINKDALYSLSTSQDLMETYNRTIHLVRTIIYESFSDLSKDDIEFIIFAKIEKFLEQNFMKKERNPPIFFYMNDKITKVTIKYDTVSIVSYNSGKLNIHGIKSDIELINVYRWLVDLLKLYLNEFGGHVDSDVCESEYTKLHRFIKTV